MAPARPTVWGAGTARLALAPVWPAGAGLARRRTRGRAPAPSAPPDGGRQSAGKPVERVLARPSRPRLGSESCCIESCNSRMPCRQAHRTGAGKARPAATRRTRGRAPAPSPPCARWRVHVSRVCWQAQARVPQCRQGWFRVRHVAAGTAQSAPTHGGGLGAGHRRRKPGRAPPAALACGGARVGLAGAAPERSRFGGPLPNGRGLVGRSRTVATSRRAFAVAFVTAHPGSHRQGATSMQTRPAVRRVRRLELATDGPVTASTFMSFANQARQE